MTAPKLRELILPDPSHTQHPSQDWYQVGEAIGLRLPRTRRRLDIMSTLATGWLPWGVSWSTHLTRSHNTWILCCGHVLEFTEAQAFVSAGLLTPISSTPIAALGFPERHGDLVITEAGKTWLQRNWSGPAKARGPRPEPRERPAMSTADF